jgi:hypothetical protein
MEERIMKTKTIVSAMLLAAGLMATGMAMAEKPAAKKAAGAAEDTFYIFSDRGSRLNHFIPSGWMGDYGDLKMNQGWVKGNAPAKKKEAKEGEAAAGPAEDTCIQIKYSAERKQGNGWAGIYWQHPANNWGDKRGGFDLSAYSKMSFMAKGEQGGEVIDKFFIGGITGQTEEGDSDEASVSPVTLTKDWKKYEISLKGLDMSHIIGGFGFAANADANPSGFTLYVDDVKLEK